MRKRNQNLSEDQLAERFAGELFEPRMRRRREVSRQIEPTVQLLILRADTARLLR